MKKYILTMLLAFSVLGSFAQDDDDNYSRKTTKKSKHNLGKNILSFSPLHLISDDQVGIGLSYEHLVNEYVGIKIPVMVGLNQPYANISVEAKLYPAKNSGKITYAIAPTLSFGAGENRYYDNYWNGSQWVSTERVSNRTHFGFLLNNSINFTIVDNFYIGLDGGLGINYIDNRNNYYNSNNNMSLAGQLHMSLGVRF